MGGLARRFYEIGYESKQVFDEVNCLACPEMEQLRATVAFDPFPSPSRGIYEAPDGSFYAVSHRAEIVYKLSFTMERNDTLIMVKGGVKVPMPALILDRRADVKE